MPTTSAPIVSLFQSIEDANVPFCHFQPPRQREVCDIFPGPWFGLRWLRSRSTTDSHVPIRATDLPAIDSSFPNGGSVFSVHAPLQADAWLDAHCGDSVVRALNVSGLRGPLPAMLGPTLSALVLFGATGDRAHHKHAKRLAYTSGLAVLLRALEDFPVFGPDLDLESSGDVGASGGETAEETTAEEKQGVLRLRGGAGSDDGPIWEGPLHRGAVKANFQLLNSMLPNENSKFSIVINSTFGFKTQPERLPFSSQDNKPLSQPQLEGIATMHIDPTPHAIPDRSYANIGFLGHRQDAIFSHDYLECGQVAPRWSVKYSLGQDWDVDDASYVSYDATFLPLVDETNPEDVSPFRVKFGMGISFFRGYEDVRMSFVLRTQLYLWVCAPKPKGIVLLLSTYIPNARTRECLHIHATPTIKIDANTWLQDPPNPNQAGAACDAGLSVAVAIIDPSRAGRSNFTFLRRAVTTIRRLTKGRSSAKISVISFNNIQWHDYISRGWDTTTETWRTVVWPKFVADARGPDAGFLPLPWNYHEAPAEVATDSSEIAADGSEITDASEIATDGSEVVTNGNEDRPE